MPVRSCLSLCSACIEFLSSGFGLACKLERFMGLEFQIQQRSQTKDMEREFQLL